MAILCQKYLNWHNGFSYNFYKNGEWYLLKTLSRMDFRFFFDVGSNVGEWSLFAAKLFPKAVIHGFELSNSTYNILVDNMKAYKQFVPNNAGLSNKAGIFQYKDYGQNSGHNTILQEVTFMDKTIQPEFMEAQLTTGDVYCTENSIPRIDFLKIDVEGAEHLVLEGFNGMLKNQAIRVIQFEYGYANGDAKFLMKDFYKLFDSYGYKTGRIRKQGIDFSEWTYKHNDFNSGPNYVAVRQDDNELISLLSI